MHRSTPGAFEKNGVYYKEVQDIRAKDKVLALNEKTGEERYSVVKQTFILEADEIYELTYEDGTLVETTWNHPFYVHGKGWTKAENLVAGDVSRTEGNGSLKITRVRVLERAETVYNFEVEEDHNYYVSEAGVLVHNEAGCEGFGIAIAISEKCGSNRRCIDENYKAYQKGKLLGAQHAPIAAPFVGLAAMAVAYAPELAVSAYIGTGSGVGLGETLTALIAGDAYMGNPISGPIRKGMTLYGRKVRDFKVTINGSQYKASIDVLLEDNFRVMIEKSRVKAQYPKVLDFPDGKAIPSEVIDKQVKQWIKWPGNKPPMKREPTQSELNLFNETIDAFPRGKNFEN